MSEHDLVLAAALDGLLPLRLDRAPAWEDVLVRAGVAPAARDVFAVRPRRRGARRVALALAIVVGALLIGSAVAAAFGHDVFGGLSSWLGGAPGGPATPAQQAGFSQRNGASYASFPPHTRLRLLQTESVQGRGFSLLGFRNGGSLCLRLVPSKTPAFRGVNQCVTLRELRRSPVPAVVASTAYYPIHGGRVAAIFGFADDTVRSVRVTHSAGGTQTVSAVNNVFLALQVGPSDPIYDPVVQITARLRSNASVVLPFTTLGALVRPAVPSYLRYDRVHLPGPTSRQGTLARAGISWLDHRELRGGSFTPSAKAYGPKSRLVVFARSVQPDPDDAYRIGLAVIRIERVSPPFNFTWTKGSASVRPHRVLLRPGMVLVCADELFPLRPAPVFNNCVLDAKSGGLFPPDRVLTINRMYREAFTRVSGLAADGVREVDLYLASGRVIPAALRDNAYTVQAPSAQWPAKLVAYDRAGRVLEIAVIDRQRSQAVVTPCPPAEATNVSGGPAPSYERLDLAASTVDGNIVLGQTRSAIARALGGPDASRGQDLLYGTTPGGDAAVTIHLARRGNAMRAVWLEVRGAGATDARIGSLLLLQPVVLQRKIAAAYPAFEHGFAYGSEPALLGCEGTFRSRNGSVEVAFGLDPGRPSDTFLRLSDTRVGSGSRPAAAGAVKSVPSGRLLVTIAFTAGTQPKGFHIDLARPDGTVRAAHLASSRAIPIAPVWAPDGSQFLVADDRGIFVVQANGSSEIRVTGLTSAYTEIAWSPDSRRIAFSDHNMLFVVDADGGGGLERLTRYADFNWAWSPDGRRIVYVGVADGGRKALFVVNTSGAPRPRQIRVALSGHMGTPSYFSPTWTPDGSRIAFECCSSGYQPNGNWIYLVRLDGSGLTRAFQGDIRAWSPDGRSFLVSRGFNAVWKLFLLRSDGTFVRQLPGCSRGCGLPVWLPDSKRIVYAEDLRIYVARVDGSARRLVAVARWPFPDFSVSPDGSTIAYAGGASVREHNRRLSVVRVDGSHRRIVARSSTTRFWNPVWRPDPRRRTVPGVTP